MSSIPERSYRTPLPALLATSLEAAINRLLAADQDSGERLRKLDGRRVRLNLQDLAITLDFVFGAYRVGVSLDTAAEADTVISGSMPALFVMALPDEEDRWGGPGSRVKISGDATLARDLERLFSRLDPDWESAVAQYTGDVMAHQLIAGLKGIATSLVTTGRHMQEVAGEYLSSEQSPLPQTEKLRGFADEVDNLRDAVERLEARMRVLLENQDHPASKGNET